MRILQILQENVADLSKFRQQKQDADSAKEVQAASNAIENMKGHLHAAINTSIDSLVEAGMSEDRATLVVMTYLGDIVMADDIS